MCSVPSPTSPQKQGITPLQWVGLGALILLFLYQLGFLQFQNGSLGLGGLEEDLPRFVALVLAITVHEFSHGFVATLFGDDLPRRVGRLTLNPLRHLDPLGTLLILIGAPIGWGKPMPINPAAMRNPNLGWALSSAAGPISNVLAASVVDLAATLARPFLTPALLPYVEEFKYINVTLAVFNLLPVPPLDGFGFVFGLVPTPVKIALQPLQRYGPILLLAILFVPQLRPILTTFISAGDTLVFRYLDAISSAI